jgi:hypothetical protein
LLLIGQQGLEHFLQASTLVSYLLEDLADFAPTAERMTNGAPTTLSEVLTASQSNFVNPHQNDQG